MFHQMLKSVPTVIHSLWVSTSDGRRNSENARGFRTLNPVRGGAAITEGQAQGLSPRLQSVSSETMKNLDPFMTVQYHAFHKMQSSTLHLWSNSSSSSPGLAQADRGMLAPSGHGPADLLGDHHPAGQDLRPLRQARELEGVAEDLVCIPAI